MSPISLQAAFALPVILALMAYLAMHGRVRSGLRPLMQGVLLGFMGFVLGDAFLSTEDPTLRTIGQLSARVAGCGMPPLFFLLMARHARIESIERRPAVAWTIGLPFLFFFALFLTNGSHHLMVEGSMGGGARPLGKPGPFFWSYQTWVFGTIFAGLTFLARSFRSPRAEDRRRALLILVATLIPVVVHGLFLAGAFETPMRIPTFTLSAVLIAAGFTRLGLFEGQALLRRDALEHMSDGLVMADEDDHVVDVNAAGERMLGCSRDELAGRELAEVFSLLDPITGPEPREGGGGRGSMQTRDGRMIEFEASQMLESEHEGSGRFLVMRDRTEQHQTDQLSQRRQRLESLGVLAAGIAHEVNNPLAYLRANLAHLHRMSELVEKLPEMPSDHPAEELLEMADVVVESQDGLERIAHIVERMLRFVRPEAETTAPADLGEVACTALRLAALPVGGEEPESGVRVELELSEELPRVEAAESRLTQVVLNLLLNARRAVRGRSPATIRVETGSNAEEVWLRVSDDGPGIPPGSAERIFDPFFTTSEPGQGTGLGLPIAAEIAREFGGALLLEPGPGARFRLRLPRAHEA